MGASLQGTPYSASQGKVVELPGGEHARSSGSKDISNIGGWELLDNNQVGFLPSPLLFSLSRIGNLICDSGEFCNDFYYESIFHGIVFMVMSDITQLLEEIISSFMNGKDC